MASLKAIRDRVKNFKGRELEIALSALNANSRVAADLNAEQLAQGIMKDGKLSKFKYSPLTIEIKKTKSGLSAVVDHLTNYDTGESYRKLYMKAGGEVIIFGTYTDKEDSISKRMKGKAFGLTKDNKEEFMRLHVQKTFNEKVREILQL
jgi:hypothetical protein